MTKRGLCWEMTVSCFGISDKVGDLFATPVGCLDILSSTDMIWTQKYFFQKWRNTTRWGHATKLCLVSCYTPDEIEKKIASF